MHQLLTFSNAQQDNLKLRRLLTSEAIAQVSFYALGPEGTNISQASRAWATKCGIMGKSNFYLCSTPEQSVALARTVTDGSTLPLFVTCAVYNRLAELYFTNTDCNAFLGHHYMKLDDMQLAARESTSRIPENWVIASHPSPQHLVSGLKNRLLLVASNAVAAEMCAQSAVQACITTESARKLHGLQTIHSFGSPTMLFLFGTTPHGMALLDKAKEAVATTNSENEFSQRKHGHAFVHRRRLGSLMTARS